MAVRKKVSIPHHIKQVWREMQSQIGNRLSDFDAWAVQQVNDNLEGIGDKFNQTLETIQAQ
ncbi:MAG: hypothetical protein ACK4QL_11800 [Pseudanabaenaceae cyanobacterium]